MDTSLLSILYRLRYHDDPRLYEEADVLMSEAAGTIERLMASIAGIHCHAIMGSSHETIAAECEAVIPRLAELRPNQM